ncbi:hypothetical protein GGI35DRAFT_157128 [Trichoderma velutinum]
MLLSLLIFNICCYSYNPLVSGIITYYYIALTPGHEMLDSRLWVLASTFLNLPWSPLYFAIYLSTLKYPGSDETRDSQIRPVYTHPAENSHISPVMSSYPQLAVHVLEPVHYVAEASL